jgi:hypothetical protein
MLKREQQFTWILVIVTTDGVCIANWIYWTLTERNYSAIANSHTLQFTIARIKPSQSAIFTSRCLVTASNGGRSRTIPVPQLPSFYQQRLTRTKPQQSSNSLTNQLSPLHSTALHSLTALIITSRHGPHRTHRFRASPMVHVRSVLPSNRRCSQHRVYMSQYVPEDGPYGAETCRLVLAGVSARNHEAALKTLVSVHATWNYWN